MNGNMPVSSPTFRFDILAMADLCFDIIISGPDAPQFNQVELLVDDYIIDLGGSVGIFACQFAKLGGTIALLGNVGKDIPGQIIIDRLKGAGVETSLISVYDGEKTAMGLNLFCKGDRAMLTCLGVMDQSIPAIFSAALSHKAKHWHIGGYFLLRELIHTWPVWVQTLKAQGVSISLDTNWDPSGKWENVYALLPMIDIFLPNEAEAMAISGKKNITEAGLFLAEVCPLVVIKMGEQGAMVFKQGNENYYPLPASLTAALHIVDTTGAGDNFDAGFIFSWLSGAAESSCIENAFRCAVSSLTGLGGIAKQIVNKTDLKL
ncbi:carbohydrate kinase family protein [Chitinophaga defluvii]|uniref:Carbohydrate kinase family protein n=1 Tax=Chitinophaga defluvii TaxID=3163343 RepID=A0ABV2T236_9BACT